MSLIRQIVIQVLLLHYQHLDKIEQSGNKHSLIISPEKTLCSLHSSFNPTHNLDAQKNIKLTQNIDIDILLVILDCAIHYGVSCFWILCLVRYSKKRDISETGVVFVLR